MFLKTILFPFSILYGCITWLRNRMYDSGLKRAVSFDLAVINVGNLTVGGTGKTPHIEYLIRLLKGSYRLATLSRGYGRKTRGFVKAEKGITAKVLGDEPLQFAQKFGDEVLVTVCEERLVGIPSILMEESATQVVLLDDAYQHRPVQPSLNILLNDYNRPFYQDFLLPAGRLRESRKGAVRADAIVVSKCPLDISHAAKTQIREQIARYAGKDTAIFFSGLQYGSPQPISAQTVEKINDVFLVSGIAQPQVLEDYVRRHFKLLKTIYFPDHHDYSTASIQKIKAQWQALPENCIILTTEKDAVKLTSPENMQLLAEAPLYTLPIEVKFLGDDATHFNQLVMEHVKEQVSRQDELDS